MRAAPAPADDPLGLGAMDPPRLLALRAVLAGAEAALTAAEAGLAVSIYEDCEGFYVVLAADAGRIDAGRGAA